MESMWKAHKPHHTTTYSEPSSQLQGFWFLEFIKGSFKEGLYKGYYKELV